MKYAILDLKSNIDKETEKAILYKKIWLPKSQLRLLQSEGYNSKEILIPTWLADKNYNMYLGHSKEINEFVGKIFDYDLNVIQENKKEIKGIELYINKINDCTNKNELRTVKKELDIFKNKNKLDSEEREFINEIYFNKKHSL